MSDPTAYIFYGSFMNSGLLQCTTGLWHTWSTAFVLQRIDANTSDFALGAERRADPSLASWGFMSLPALFERLELDVH